MIILLHLLSPAALAHESAYAHDHDEDAAIGAVSEEAGSLAEALDGLLEPGALPPGALPPGASGPEAAPIINGAPATADDYPQAGAMILDADLDMGSYGSGSVRMFTCSSTLIAPDVVLLAAHCLDEVSYTYGYGTMEINEIQWTRQADLTDLDGTSRGKADWTEDGVVAWDWVKHEDFNLYQLSMGIAENYDIALLFLEEPVLDTPFAYIPTEEETDQLVEGMMVTVVGWGQQVASESAYEAPEPGTYALKYMGEAPVGEVGEPEFQVGPSEDDVRKCHGDSGGPTFARIETDSTETLRVIGVTSHAYDRTDCDSKGGVDTRVMAYRGWIEAQMIERCEDGTRAWCETPGLPLPPVPEPEPEVVDDGEKLDGEGDEKRACACATATPRSAAPWALGLLGLALARRRRS